MIAYETRIGKVNISENYFEKIIGDAVTSCYGVAGMVASGGKQRIVDVFTKKDAVNKGLVIKGNADSIIVELHIIVVYGMNINAIAKSIVHKVQYTVEELTGIKVNKVVVKVDGIKE